ncbi:hypothetical protein DFS34DRAFT_462760 [Phlyctochytrium arcticum]|nr:hypothetical protein DFS34DRAFT_462760 [Phlyctochytrium arcticum]
MFVDEGPLPPLAPHHRKHSEPPFRKCRPAAPHNKISRNRVPQRQQKDPQTSRGQLAANVGRRPSLPHCRPVPASRGFWSMEPFFSRCAERCLWRHRDALSHSSSWSTAHSFFDGGIPVRAVPTRVVDTRRRFLGHLCISLFLCRTLLVFFIIIFVVFLLYVCMNRDRFPQSIGYLVVATPQQKVPPPWHYFLIWDPSFMNFWDEEWTAGLGDESLMNHYESFISTSSRFINEVHLCHSVYYSLFQNVRKPRDF